jgi:TonB family protein
MIGTLIALLTGGQAATPSPPIAVPIPTPPRVAPPPPAPPSAMGTRPRLRAGTISSDDYPLAALREGAEGTTLTAFDVGPNGRASNCTIRTSAGHPALDEAACRLVVQRLRYEPARTAAGAPVSAPVIQRVVWRMPEPARIEFLPGSLTWSVVASPSGIANCDTALDGRAFAEFDEALCREDGESELVEHRAIRAGSRPLRVTSILSLTPLTGAMPPLPERPQAAVDSVADLEIGADGALISCTVVRQRGTRPAYAFPDFHAFCSDEGGEPVFVPAAAGTVRSARIEAVLYVGPAVDGRDRRP